VGGALAQSQALPESEALAVLVSVQGLGPTTLARLLARCGSAGRLVAIAAAGDGRAALRDLGADLPGGGRLDATVIDGLARAASRAPEILEAIRAAGLGLVTLADEAYPRRLREIEMPPHVLFVAGEQGALAATRAVAVVGTRHPTEGGRRLASRIAAALARAGASVVSGLAVGVDGAAHAAALAEHGETVAVLGGGHGQLYPRAHQGLADAIVKAGGAVVSEFGPEVPPVPGTFPRRNRLISGLSEATVVVEAGARSGALTTAAWALEQGRGCFLVPGAIDAPMSAGCLAFLREYPAETRIVAGVPQLLADLELAGLAAPARGPGRQPFRRPDPPGSAAVLAALGASERRIAAALADGLATVDELVATVDMPVAAVLAALTFLEARGLVVGTYGRYRPAGALSGGDGRGPSQRR
jgi:DNA processing protein